MSRKNRVPLVTLLLVLIGSVALLAVRSVENKAPGQSAGLPFNLGLDLQGGISLALRADFTKVEDLTPDEVIQATIDNVERRIVGNTGKEIEVSRMGKDMIYMEIPGEKDPRRVVDLLIKPAFLLFIDTKAVPFEEGKKFLSEDEDNQRLSRVKAYQDKFPEVLEKVQARKKKSSKSKDIGKEEKELEDQLALIKVDPKVLPESYTEKDYFKDRVKPDFVYKREDIIIMGADLLKASPVPARFGDNYEVSFTLRGSAANKFGTHTATNIGKYMTILLDGTVVSSPVIRSGIYGGSGVIQGNFTEASAKDLVKALNAGALPVPLKVEEERIVGPTLGAQNVSQSFMAFGIGLVGVFIFMLAMYRLPGLVAIGALVVYSIVLCASLALFHVTLTLPAIAGFILSIGMAVDTNIITFERIKDEVRHRGVLGNVVEEGHRHAYSAIWDSQFTTLIAGLVLYVLGSGQVKSFAVALVLGTAVSLYTGLAVTLVLLRLISSRVKEGNSWFGSALPKGATA